MITRTKPLPTLTEKEIARFLARLEPTAHGCLEWTGPTIQGGYGSWTVGRPEIHWNLLVHRVAWYLGTGEWPPDDREVDHQCHNNSDCRLGDLCPHRRCANFAHLELATPLENQRRGHTNATKTHCPQGHPYDEANTYVYPKRPMRSCKQCRRERQRRVRRVRKTAS